MNTLSDLVNARIPQMQTWRRDLHQYAESGWLEFRTATLVAEELHRLGYQLQLGREVIDADARMGLPSAEVLAQQEARALQQGALPQWLPHFSGGFCGVVATLDTGRPGPVMGFRVDMDALDQTESAAADHLPTREGFASCNPGMMHACGHDGHTTIGLALAGVLMAMKHQLSGRIKLIFQPAEEGVRGAKAMVAAGVLDDVDLFTAIHLGTGVPPGEIVCGSDSFLATTKLDVRFTGVGAHAGGKPEEGRNALLAAAQATLALHTLPQHSGGVARVNVGVLQAGSGRNVVPDVALMKVETRGASNQVNDDIYQQALRVIAGAAAMYGVEHEVTLMGGARSCTPSPAWVSFIHQQAEATGLFSSVIDSKQQAAGSEDATYMMERVQQRGGQASYVIFGCDLAAGHHNARFDFDEAVMATAVLMLATLALNQTQFGGAR
ncbi:amidohydrolase [Pantoea dispersa]|jgi:aminobenzoyl-glutamate utilization protein A|uniref:Peptidase M20 n=1 Tax=Pantoea dispersa TaxID=59814 RepID=A0A8E1V8U1_9GAMM|nr:amidohydrolase [Pantoea dispersa]KTR88895.1 peptidase M20 [Pantoea dispersa]KTS22456.1 peptidase M20 [Pantoea dispersa]KTS63554.1 peptidase M20 [Pantoea dispersa]KTS66812.1 peptidase M20 [Pantoea dispersa]